MTHKVHQDEDKIGEKNESAIEVMWMLEGTIHPDLHIAVNGCFISQFL